MTSSSTSSATLPPSDDEDSELDDEDSSVACGTLLRRTEIDVRGPVVCVPASLVVLGDAAHAFCPMRWTGERLLPRLEGMPLLLLLLLADDVEGGAVVRRLMAGFSRTGRRLLCRNVAVLFSDDDDDDDDNDDNDFRLDDARRELLSPFRSVPFVSATWRASGRPSRDELRDEGAGLVVSVSTSHVAGRLGVADW